MVVKDVLKKTRIILQEKLLKIKREKYSEKDPLSQMNPRTHELNNIMKSLAILITFNTQAPYRKFCNNIKSMLHRLALEFQKELRVI